MELLVSFVVTKLLCKLCFVESVKQTSKFFWRPGLQIVT